MTAAELRASFEDAECFPTDAGDGYFQALCPACAGWVLATVRDERPDISCSNGCGFSRIADELHNRITGPAVFAETNGHKPGLFTSRLADLAKARPTSFLWRPYLVRSRLNLLVGEEGVGKSTVEMWIAARATRGKLSGDPVRVLFVGADEDDWNEVVIPRLYALEADLSFVEEFVATDDVTIFNVDKHAVELSRVLKAGNFGLVVFEQLMDTLPPLKNNVDPMEIRRVLRPLRHVLAARETTGLATLHVNKAQAEQLRQRMQGSMQFGALSRSTMLVAKHPREEGRRVLVLGKRNYVAEEESAAYSFRIASRRFDLNGHAFDVGRLEEIRDEEMTIGDALASTSGDAENSVREQVADALLDWVKGEVQRCTSLKGVAPCTPDFSLAQMARAIGRDPRDGTVRNALADLVGLGLIASTEKKRWQPTQALLDD